MKKGMILGIMLMFSIIFVSSVSAHTFSTNDIEGVAAAPLTADQVVISWCDETENDISFAIYNTSGAEILAATDVNRSLTSCHGNELNPLSVSAFNSTHFVLAYSVSSVSAASFVVYDINGNNFTDVSLYGTSDSISVSTFNSTHFVVAWVDTTADDASFQVYNINGSNLTGVIDADASAGSGAHSISVSTFNSTHFVVGWFHYGYNASFQIFDVDGVNITSQVDADDEVGVSANNGISVSTFNSTHFVVGWYDQAAADITFRTYDITGNPIINSVDVDTNAGSSSYAISVSILNSTHFVVGWYDDASDDISFATYNVNGSIGVSTTDVDTNSLDWHYVTSESVATNIEFSDDKFVIVWVDSVSMANWSVYNPNGTLYRVDITAPTWSNNITNDTSIRPDDVVEFNVTWSDDFALSGWIFRSNYSGVWTNYTFNTTWGVNDESVYYAIINVSENEDVGWRFYANDSSNYWNETDIFSFTVQDTISPIATIEINHTSPRIDYHINISSNATDNIELSHCIFWNDMSSINSTPIVLSGVSDSCSNVTSINATAGTVVTLRVYVNDTSNNWHENSTTITVASTPTDAETAVNLVVRSLIDISIWLPIVAIIIIGGIIVMLWKKKDFDTSSGDLMKLVLFLIGIAFLVVIAIIIMNNVPTS